MVERNICRCSNNLNVKLPNDKIILARCSKKNGVIILDGQQYSIRQGEYFLLCQHKNISFQTEEEEFVIEYILFGKEIVDRLYSDESTNKKFMEKMGESKIVIFECSKFPELTGLVRNLFFEMTEKRSWYQECMEAMLEIILINLFRDIENHVNETMDIDRFDTHQYIHPALEYIEVHYGETIRISKLAQICHLSESYFRQIFYEKMKQTPLDYINRIRINRACEMIRETDYPIEIISYSVGFRSMSTFYRNFKKEYHCSPAKYKMHFVNNALKPKNRSSRTVENDKI